MAALAALPEHVRAGARLVFVTHSIPTAMDDVSGPGGGATSPSTGTSRADRGGVRARRPAAAPRLGPRLLLPLRAPGQPWLEPDVNDHLRGAARRRASPAVVLVPIGFVSRPHGGHVRPRHRGAGDRGGARARRSPGPPRSAPTRASWPPCVDLVLERPRHSCGRGRPSSRPSAPLGPGTRPCARSAAAQPARGAPAACGADWPASARRSRPMTGRRRRTARPDTGALVRARRARGARRRRPACADGRARPDQRSRPPSRARPTSSPRPTGRGGAAARRCCAPRRPDDGFARRGGRHADRHQRPDLGGRPDRRHGELPLRHPGVCGERRRRGGRPAVPGGGRRWRAACTTRRPGRPGRRRGGSARTSTGRPLPVHRPPPPLDQALVSTGFGYTVAASPGAGPRGRGPAAPDPRRAPDRRLVPGPVQRRRGPAGRVLRARAWTPGTSRPPGWSRRSAA